MANGSTAAVAMKPCAPRNSGHRSEMAMTDPMIQYGMKSMAVMGTSVPRYARAVSDLTHIDDRGRATMVDVGAKDVTERRAVARATVRMSAATARAVQQGDAPKGDVLGTARLAGVMAAKRTDELIPLCHSLPLSFVGVEAEVGEGGVTLTAEARTHAQTGVEMEALTAASVAALTVYDMVKGLEKGVEIAEVVLVEKTGGKSGDWRRA
jgi:cyclic pyranopterin monophosphate synthase